MLLHEPNFIKITRTQKTTTVLSYKLIANYLIQTLI